MKVNLHIDRLVLDGLSIPHHRESELRAAVEAELHRLFAIKGLTGQLQTGGTISHIRGSEIQLNGNAENSPSDLGRQIARAVYRGLNQ